MYSTQAERIETARRSYEQAAEAQAAIWRKMDRVEKKAEKASGALYEDLVSEIDLLRVQGLAVGALCSKRWEQLMSLAKI